MIGVAFEPGFFARHLLEMTLCRLRPTLLQALTKGAHARPRLLNLLTAKSLTLAIGSQIDDAQIYSKRIARCVGSRGRNFKRDSQIEITFTVNQISLHLDALESRLLIASNQEGNKHSARESQKGNVGQTLETHHPGIIDNGPFCLEGWLNALISLVSFGGLADRADSQLSRKLVGGTQLTVHEPLQCKLVRSLRSPGDRSDVVGRRIELRQGVKQGLVLFFSWSKLQEHGLFHRTSVSSLRGNVTMQEETQPKPQTRTRHSSRPMKGDGPPASIRVKRDELSRSGIPMSWRDTGMETPPYL